MKRFLAGLAALITPYIYAQQGEITFKELKHDFGRISEDILYATHKFEFTNTGSGPLLINNVQTSCGCTTPDWSRDTIAPGESGFVIAKYETINRLGSFHKTLTVYSNARNSGFVHLDIEGDVYKEQPVENGIPVPDLGKIVFDQPTLEFNPLYDNGMDTQYVHLVNSTPYNTSFALGDKIPAFASVSGIPENLDPNENARIMVVLDGSKMGRYGFGAFEIPLTTTSPVAPAIGLYIAYTRKQHFEKLNEKQLKKAPKISFDREFHDFGERATGDVMETTFTVTNTGKEELKLHEIYPECSCVSVSYPKKALAPGESMNILVRFDTVTKTGISNQGIWIVSNDPTRDEMHIYLRATMPPKNFHCPTCK